MTSRAKNSNTVILKTFCCFSAVILLLIIVTTIILNIRIIDRKQVNFFKNSMDWTEKKTDSARPFVFLTQTEQCLRQKLITNLELSTSLKCRCDVIVLSYQRECRAENSPSHVRYLFDNTSTWGSGRNTLFFQAMDRRPGYVYYIFTDDDIALKFNDATTPEMKQLTPILIFQNWLLDYEPAVGVVDYEFRKEGRNVRNKMRAICEIFNSSSLSNPTIFYDPVFNAFHAKAARHIFPLDTRHERVNWWMTDKYLASVVELKFRGQALIFFPVTVENPLHRGYPRSLKGTEEAWRGFIENVQREAPVQYANHSLFEEYKKNPAHYVATSRTYCKNVTRHLPIEPFAHFESEK